MKFIRMAINADSKLRKEISDKVSKGELRLSYFAVDGDNSYHYYQIIK